MKTMIAVVSMCSAVMFGCAGGNQNVQPASPNQANANPEIRCRQVDGFVVAGDMIADGSRFVWDESVKAYRYLTSDEMKNRASAIWNATTDAIHKASDEAQKVYRERVGSGDDSSTK